MKSYQKYDVWYDLLSKYLIKIRVDNKRSTIIMTSIYKSCLSVSGAKSEKSANITIMKVYKSLL